MTKEDKPNMAVRLTSSRHSLPHNQTSQSNPLKARSKGLDKIPTVGDLAEPRPPPAKKLPGFSRLNIRYGIVDDKSEHAQLLQTLRFCLQRENTAGPTVATTHSVVDSAAGTRGRNAETFQSRSSNEGSLHTASVKYRKDLMRNGTMSKGRLQTRDISYLLDHGWRRPSVNTISADDPRLPSTIEELMNARRGLEPGTPRMSEPDAKAQVLLKHDMFKEIPHEFYRAARDFFADTLTVKQKNYISMTLPTIPALSPLELAESAGGAPSSRNDSIALMRWLQYFLEKIAGPESKFDEAEKFELAQTVYYLGFREAIRQVSVQCAERGKLLLAIWNAYFVLMESVPERYGKITQRVVKEFEEQVEAQQCRSVGELGEERTRRARVEQELGVAKDVVSGLNSELAHFKKKLVEETEQTHELHKKLEEKQREFDMLHEKHEVTKRRVKILREQLYGFEDDACDDCVDKCRERIKTILQIDRSVCSCSLHQIMGTVGARAPDAATASARDSPHPMIRIADLGHAERAVAEEAAHEETEDQPGEIGSAGVAKTVKTEHAPLLRSNTSPYPPHRHVHFIGGSHTRQPSVALPVTKPPEEDMLTESNKEEHRFEVILDDIALKARNEREKARAEAEAKLIAAGELPPPVFEDAIHKPGRGGKNKADSGPGSTKFAAGGAKTGVEGKGEAGLYRKVAVVEETGTQTEIWLTGTNTPANTGGSTKLQESNPATGKRRASIRPKKPRNPDLESVLRDPASKPSENPVSPKDSKGEVGDIADARGGEEVSDAEKDCSARGKPRSARKNPAAGAATIPSTRPKKRKGTVPSINLGRATSYAQRNVGGGKGRVSVRSSRDIAQSNTPASGQKDVAGGTATKNADPRVRNQQTVLEPNPAINTGKSVPAVSAFSPKPASNDDALGWRKGQSQDKEQMTANRLSRDSMKGEVLAEESSGRASRKGSQPPYTIRVSNPAAHVPHLKTCMIIVAKRSRTRLAGRLHPQHRSYAEI